MTKPRGAKTATREVRLSPGRRRQPVEPGTEAMTGIPTPTAATRDGPNQGFRRQLGGTRAAAIDGDPKGGGGNQGGPHQGGGGGGGTEDDETYGDEDGDGISDSLQGGGGNRGNQGRGNDGHPNAVGGNQGGPNQGGGGGGGTEYDETCRQGLWGLWVDRTDDLGHPDHRARCSADSSSR